GRVRALPPDQGRRRLRVPLPGVPGRGVAVRVLHVLNELLASGADVMFREAAPYWHDMDSHVIATVDEVGPFAPDLREAGFTVHHLPFAKRPRFAVDLYRLLRQHKPDVLHIHTERANLLYVLVARFAGIRAVVRTVHSSFAFEGRLRRVGRGERGVARGLGGVAGSLGPLAQRRVHAGVGM